MTITPERLEALKSAAVELIDHGSRSPLLLVCEHASNRVPEEWGMLGLSEEALQDHIGWDIGAAGITRALARRFGASAVLAGYSRLFMDCNRDPDRSDAVPAVSDGVSVPGNEGLSAEERALRRAIAFVPLHEQIATLIDRYRADGVEPTLVSIHSFTPEMDGFRRPWSIGVLWNECDSFGEAVADALEPVDDGGCPVVIGRNEPYSAKAFLTYTLETHGRQRGLDNIAIEIRNDLAGNPASAAHVTALLEQALVRSVPRLALP